MQKHHSRQRNPEKHFLQGWAPSPLPHSCSNLRTSCRAALYSASEPDHEPRFEAAGGGWRGWRCTGNESHGRDGQGA